MVRQKKSMILKYEYGLIIRILLCFIPLSAIYFVFTPLTVYGVYGLLQLLAYDPLLWETNLFIGAFMFSIVGACIAGSAYYLLLLLILLTKGITTILRLKLFLIGALAIYAMNVIRIIVLIIIATNYGINYFELVHMVFWKFLSGIYVAAVWILLVWRFKIKGIPIWSDLKYLYGRSFLKKKKK